MEQKTPFGMILSTEKSATFEDYNHEVLSKKEIFPIVGIGASAGGLEAFTQLLQALPATVTALQKVLDFL